MHPKVAVFSSGRDKEICDDIKVHCSSDAEINLWSTDIFSVGGTTMQSLVETAHSVDFAVFIITSDDELYKDGLIVKMPNDNVIMEYGLFCGIIGGSRSILFVENDKTIRMPSNLDGITQIRFEKNDTHTACIKLKRHFLEMGAKNNINEVYYRRRIPGKRLFQHKGFYPIAIQQGTNEPKIDYDIYGKAMNYLVEVEDDQLAAIDLAFLRYDNIGHMQDPVTEKLEPSFNMLKDKYGLHGFFEADSFKRNKENMFSNYIRLVNEIGDTFRDVHCEFVLHNVMNPLRSVIAAKNTNAISRRKIGDPSTRFVVQFVQAQGADLISALDSDGKVAYFKQFDKDKKVKATTTPFYDPKYGLISILCVNIDIDNMLAMKKSEINKFIESFVANSGITPDFEKDITDQLD